MICVCNWRTAEKEREREKKKHSAVGNKGKDRESNLGR